MINLHREAKRLLLSDGYGKFDLIERVIPQEILLHERPRYIISLICITLDVDRSSFNRFTFVSWLGRYRKKVRSGVTITPLPGIEEPSGWKDFQPTIPKTVSETVSKKLIKIVKPQNDDL